MATWLLAEISLTKRQFYFTGCCRQKQHPFLLPEKNAHNKLNRAFVYSTGSNTRFIFLAYYLLYCYKPIIKKQHYGTGATI